MGPYILRAWGSQIPGGQRGWILEKDSEAMADCRSEAMGQALAARLNSHAALVEALASWVHLGGWTELPDPDDCEITEAARKVWRQTIAALKQAKGEA